MQLGLSFSKGCLQRGHWVNLAEHDTQMMWPRLHCLMGSLTTSKHTGHSSVLRREGMMLNQSSFWKKWTRWELAYTNSKCNELSKIKYNTHKYRLFSENILNTRSKRKKWGMKVFSENLLLNRYPHHKVFVYNLKKGNFIFLSKGSFFIVKWNSVKQWSLWTPVTNYFL